jgi:uncharacterized protein YukE
MAPSESTKKIIYELIVEAQSAIQGYQAAVKGNQDYQQALTQLDQKLKPLATALKQNKEEIKETGEESKNAAPKVNSFSSTLSDIAKQVGAMFALQRISELLTDAAEKFLQYRQAVFMMEVGIRGLERAGMDTTLKEWNDEITALHEKFGIFSKVDITEALAQTSLMTRNFGFTREQMSKLTQTAMVLSEITGKDLTESIRGLTFAIGSGYTEGVQRMGLNISKASLAQEALAEGYKENWNSLDPLIRAQITYNAIIRETNAIMDDAGKIQDTWAGKAMAAESNITDATVKLGSTMAPWLVKMKERWGDFLNALATGVQVILQVYTLVAAYWSAMAAQFLFVLKVMSDALQGHLITWEDFAAQYTKVFDDVYNQTILSVGEALGLVDNSLGDTNDKLEDTIDDQKAMEAEMADALETFEKDVEKIQSEAERDREDAHREHLRRLADLDLNYFRDVADINSDYDNRRLERISRNQEDEYSAEAAFQERMRSLREKYLYDLEDAVRVRDARKVLDLNRQYNMEREQRRRQFEDDQKEQQRRLEYDLAMLERERRMRLQDRALRLKQDRDDAALRLKRELEDIDRIERYKLEALLKAFAEEQKLNAENSQKVYDILAKYYGPGGAIEGLYKYYVGMVRALQAAVSTAVMSANAFSSIKSPTVQSSNLSPANSRALAGYAEGGTVVADKPTLAVFGEHGREKAEFTPLDRPGANVNKVFGNPGVGQEMSGKAVIAISLTEGLQGKIIDDALGAAASLILSAEG